MSNPFEFVNDIAFTKMNLLERDPEKEDEYDAFMVNRAFSYFSDTVMWANEANKINTGVDKKPLHDFLFHVIRKQKRYSGSWGKKKFIENLDIIKEFFQYNNQKALTALSILTDEQIDEIRELKGGLNK